MPFKSCVFLEMLLKWIILFYCGILKDNFSKMSSWFFWSDIKSVKFDLRSVCLLVIKYLKCCIFYCFVENHKTPLSSYLEIFIRFFCCGFVVYEKSLIIYFYALYIFNVYISTIKCYDKIWFWFMIFLI